jgi:hypothetical protein
MRTSLVALAVLAFVPSTAFADDAAPVETNQQTQQAPKANTADGSKEDMGGYSPPHFVAYQGGVLPPGARIETKPNVGLIATGVSTFGVAYLGAFLYALGTCSAQQECRAGSNWLYLPIAGPFITAATAPTSGGAALAAFDGGVQVLGAALTIAGFLAPKKFVMWQSTTATLKLSPTSGSLAAPAVGSIGAPTVGGGVAITLTHL